MLVPLLIDNDKEKALDTYNNYLTSGIISRPRSASSPAPISTSGKVVLLDPLAGVHHSSNKYVDKLHYIESSGQAYLWDDIDKSVNDLPCLVNTRPDYIDKNDLA